MKTYKYSPLPCLAGRRAVPPNGGKPGAMLCQEDPHSFQQFCSTDFQPCRGKILVARGKAMKECRPGLDETQFFRPRLNGVQSKKPVSDGIWKIKKRSFYRFVLTMLYVGICAVGFSQPADSLMTYLELAAKNNPSVQLKFTEYQAALQKVPQVGSLPDPELNVGVFLSPMELVAGKQVADIRLMQMFPWFGVLKNAKDEMSLMAKAKFESFRETKLQVFYDVQRTFYELQRIEQSIRINEKNLEILLSLERLALAKFKAASVGGGNSSGSLVLSGNSTSAQGSSGMNSIGGNAGTSAPQASAAMPASPMAASGGSGLIDIYQIQMQTGELENSIALLKNQEQTITARFNGFLNRQPQSVVSLSEEIIADTLTIDLSVVSDSLFKNNPMLGMLGYEQQSLEARKAMVTKMGYPMVGLGLNYSLIQKDPASMNQDMNGKDMIMPMVTVTLPIYRKKYLAMREEIELMKTANKQGYQATANSLQSEYYEAIQLYRDAQRRMKLYDNQYELAGKSLNILEKSFSVSDSGLADLLTIQQQMLNYELKKIEAVLDNNTAVAWLRRLMAHSQIQ